MAEEPLYGSPALRELDTAPAPIRELRRPVLAGTLAAGAMIAQLVFGKAARDASFLSTFQVSLLPMAMIGTAALSALAVVGVSRAMTRHSPARVVPWLFVTSALLFVGEACLSLWSAPAATAVFYVHMGVFGATVISSFWSMVNERFDPHTAKRVIGRIVTGGTIGGIVGSIVAWRVSAFLNVPALLLLLAGLNALCFWGTLPMRATTSTREDLPAAGERARSASGLSYLRDTPYLRHLGWLVGLAGVGSSLLDYVVAARAVSFASGRSLMAFFAILYMSIALVGFLVQLLLARISLEKLGVTGTVTTLPVAIVGVGLAAFALPGLGTVVALRAIEAVVQNSLFRSGYELLYAPIARERKRALKLIIDVGFERSGTTVGSAIALLVVWSWPGSAERLLLGGVVATAAAGVLISRRLHAGYVDTLEESMRARSEHVERRDAARQSVAPSEMSARERGKLDDARRSRMTVAPAASLEQDAEPDSLVAAIMDLRSGDASRIRRVLSAASIDPLLVGHLVPLLANDQLVPDTVHALRSIASGVSGQLVDALLDPARDVVTRRRIPRVLRVCKSRSVVAGLTSALADGLFDIRHQSALALAHIAESRPDLTPSAAEVLAAVLREVGADKVTWDSQRLEDAVNDDDEQVDDIMRERSRSLGHVFTLLSLVHDREPLELAFRALSSEDDRLRGTALEYLENILSLEIRERLWTYLGDLREYRRSARSRDELLEELRRLAVDRLMKAASATTNTTALASQSK